MAAGGIKHPSKTELAYIINICLLLWISFQAGLYFHAIWATDSTAKGSPIPQDVVLLG
ncbi:hypothetical protein DFAR_390001 [Desulfarculales bacterium]